MEASYTIDIADFLLFNPEEAPSRTRTLQTEVYPMSIPGRTVAGVASLLVAATVLATPGYAEVKAVLETSVVSAVVYGDRAQVTRSGSVEIAGGMVTIVCDDLPYRFDPASLRVTGSGTAISAILGTDVIELKEDPTASPRYIELRERLETLEVRRDSVETGRQALEARKKFVEELGNLPMKQTGEGFPSEIFAVEDWRTLMDFLQSERAATQNAAAALSRKTEEIDEEIEWLRRELSGMQGSAARGRRVAVEVSAERAGRLDLSLSYIVMGTSWHPEYSIRYHPGSEDVVLTYNARLSQSTGEDWDGVEVTLSTAIPHAGAAPIRIKPAYLGRIRRRPSPDMLEARAGRAGEIMQEFSVDDLAPAAAMVHKEAEVSTSPFAASFTLPAPVSLASGAEPKRVRIMEKELAGEIGRYAAPRLKGAVYVSAEAENTLGAPVLEGPADVYIETSPENGGVSTFVGKEGLGPAAAGESLELHLGIDRDMKVSHELVRREYLEKEGEKEQKIRYHYLITLENYNDGPVEVVLQDRVPVSLIEEVEVDDVDIEPEPDEKEENGILTWNLTPAAGGKIEIMMAWTIEFPGDWPEVYVEPSR